MVWLSFAAGEVTTLKMGRCGGRGHDHPGPVENDGVSAGRECFQSQKSGFARLGLGQTKQSQRRTTEPNQAVLATRQREPMWNEVLVLTLCRVKHYRLRWK